MDGYLWKVYSAVPASAAVLGLITTLHVALLMLLRHRVEARGFRLFLLIPSLLLIAAPWIFPVPIWLFSGVLFHLLWVRLCERLVRPVRIATPPPAKGAETPVSSPAPRPGRRGFQPLPVLAVVPETEEIRTFRVVRPPGFSFQPGQFLIVRVVIDGSTLTRCYSISSSPAAAGYLEISVRNQGKVSAFLHGTLQPGGVIEVQGPGGSFIHPGPGDQPLALVAAGIGITPLLSVLRHTLECEPERRVALVLSARGEEHVPFLDDLRLLRKRHPQFRLALTLSRGTDKPEFFSGRIDRGLLESVIEDPEHSICFICGPLPMIDGTRELLRTLGVPDSQIHFEKFEAAVASATAIAAPAREAGAGAVKVTLRESGRVLQMHSGESILDAAEAAGEELPSMCRAGVCGTCQIRLLEGEVDGDFDHLDPEDRDAGFILACIARPMTDCVIEA